MLKKLLFISEVNFYIWGGSRPHPHTFSTDVKMKDKCRKFTNTNETPCYHYIKEVYIYLFNVIVA